MRIMGHTWHLRSVVTISLVLVGVGAFAAYFSFPELPLAGSSSDPGAERQPSYASVSNDFEKVGKDFKGELKRNRAFTEERIEYFADERGLSWGIIRAKDDVQLRGDNGLDWSHDVVEDAASSERSAEAVERIELGPRAGMLLGTYATPIAEGPYDSVLVFTKYYDRELSR